LAPAADARQDLGHHRRRQGVFAGIKQQFQAMRYHSLAVGKKSLPDCLAVTATAEDGEIMGIRHRTTPPRGFSFIPNPS
jgi:anthranilate/para-aminobenzoate synthase component II